MKCGFIEPDKGLADLEDPNTSLGIPIYGGHRALDHHHHLRDRNRLFDEIVDQLQASSPPHYEDQCSVQYYFDLVRTMRDFAGEYRRVIEVGVYMGGSSGILGGLAERFDFDLDLIDIKVPFLQFSYERIRRAFPEAARRVRLFHGDLPSYVKYVLSHEDSGPCIVHHDGAHNFDQVVRDFSSLSFVREKIHALIAQDTHLRGSIENMNFVDLALYAVFGIDLKAAHIGAVYPKGHPLTGPDGFFGNYFAPDMPEGLVLPLALNSFRYPHPSATIDAFLPPQN